MEKGDINDEKLIQEVFKYRSLWDQRSLDYQNATLKVKDWALVALEMDYTVNEVKNRWKTLKDNFIRELRTTAKSGQASKWVYFAKMSFLLESFNKLLLPKGYISQSCTELDCPNISSISYNNAYSENSSVACSEENFETSERKKLKTVPKNKTEVLNSTPYQSSSAIQFNAPCREENNEDYYFLLSLLPSFERMSAQQKMFLKIKIMQDVYNTSYGESMSSIGSNSSSGIDTGSSVLEFDA